VYDPSQTKHHILGIIPNAIDIENRNRVLEHVAVALSSLREWRNHSNKFLIFAPGESHINLLGNMLYKVLSSRLSVTVVDIDPWMSGLKINRGFSLLYKKVLIAPYLIRREVFTYGHEYNRNITSMFHGDTGRYDGGRRGAVRDILKYVPHSEYRSTFKIRGNTTALQDAYRQTVYSMKRSQTCLCPSGDTPTTRRLYESLASGCVPIRIDHIPDRQLPFYKLVAWNNLTFKMEPSHMSLQQRHSSATLDIMSHRKQEATRVFDISTHASLVEIRRLGMQMADKYMNPLKPHNFIDAMLIHWN
jgi:hypothetical protein